ncbi:MAG: site-specific DNA-methyltransferase [Desulfurococcales archaeon]|nr:site-specific DNA-methyltransferase [Desulfurococcales archaeon]MCE4605303.1 site-specific DNA-methyltransferase [Desulfurococcales archaeon]
MKGEVEPELAMMVPQDDLAWLLVRLADRPEREVVLIAKDQKLWSRVESIISRLETRHIVYVGDSRRLGMLEDESVHLVLTSPPYWNIKEYPSWDGQLGSIQDYGEFLDELGRVWSEVYRVLVPGGRLVVVVGDVLLPRRKYGRHGIVPLHADIINQCRNLGFEVLSPIIWSKIGNVSREAGGRNGMLGRPYQPNAVIKSDIEYILMFRKPGYRRVSRAKMKLSTIPEPLFKKWYTQIWSIPGEQSRIHPAPFPLELAERLVRMYSYVGDTVLDPFLGTGTTMLAAMRWGRNSIGVEIDPRYARIAYQRLRKESITLIGVRRIMELMELNT